MPSLSKHQLSHDRDPIEVEIKPNKSRRRSMPLHKTDSNEDSTSDYSLFSLTSISSTSTSSYSSRERMSSRRKSSTTNTQLDPASCLDYLKRREVFLYKMMNDPSHKAMLYFLEVLMNSEAPLSVEQLAARFSNKSFSPEMRDACGGGSIEALREFLEKYPSLFTIKPSGLVTAVAIDMPGFDEISETSCDIDNCISSRAINPTASTVSSQASKLQAADTSSEADSKFAKKVVVNTNENGCQRQSNNACQKVGIQSEKSLPRASTKPISKDGSSPHIMFASEQKATSTEVKPIGIYQPPILRANPLGTIRNASFCEMCSMTALSACSHVATTAATTVVHCPFADMNCAHHPQRYAAAALKHVRGPHCYCSSSLVDSVPYCRHSFSQPSKPTCLHSAISLDNFALETEAVEFFQQRLSRREERWVPVKSLAGHLSQAAPEVRAIVGPQLEFRSFLLKYPHVFEVQGDLVGLKDSFATTCLPKRPRSFMSGLNSSSSTNLTTLNHSKLASQKVCRPKSLIMLSQASGTNPMHLRGSTRGLDHVPSSSDYFLVNGEYSAVPPGRASNSFSLADGRTAVAPVSRPTSYRQNPISPGYRFESIFASQRNAMQQQQQLQHQRTDFVSSSAAQVQSQPTSTVGTATAPERKRSQGKGEFEIMNSETSNSICIRMSGNEYRAIMFLRKVLAKKGGAPGQPGLSYAKLMQILSVKAPETVQSAIGWTKIELEEFISQHPIFFEVHEAVMASEVAEQSPVITSGVSMGSVGSGNSNSLCETLVTNRRVLKMINIVITGNKPADSGTRTLMNRCGRVFHVAKLWGIIDLGKHEHVFFDKSILKYVDDLQKHFKVNELLYFNAILAPKESRAKWRATQVWKECDKEIIEKLGGAAFTGRPLKCEPPPPLATSSSKQVNSAKGEEVEITPGRGGMLGQEPTACDVRSLQKVQQEERSCEGKLSFDSDSDYGLVDDEEIEDDELGVAAMAREEGLNLANDIKFLSDDVEEELERLLGPQVTRTTSQLLDGTGSADGRLMTYASDEDTSITGFIEDISVNFSDGSHSDGNSKVTNNRVTSSTTPKKLPALLSKPLINCPSEAPGDRSSIAVQTLSTGDIMATQIFHDIH